jgi:hypothetical protein
MGARAMPYVIEFYRDGRIFREYPWPDDLTSAKEHVVDYLPIHEASHGAVINGDTRQVIFSHPGADDA